MSEWNTSNNSTFIFKHKTNKRRAHLEDLKDEDPADFTSPSPPAHTMYFLQLHQLLFGVLQLISLIVQSDHHLSEQSEAVCFSDLILTICDSSEPLSQDICFRQAAAKQDK